MNFKNYLLTVSCLSFVISCGGVTGKVIAQSSPEGSHVAIMIEKASKPFGYELIRGYPVADEWEAEGTKNLLENHAYYTLFGKDSDASCVGIEGRIGVTVLLFKNADIARRQIALRKEYHQGNMFVEMIRSNEDGFLLKEINGIYAAVIQGSRVILFEDRSAAQSSVIKSLADILAKEPN